jgi:hypothetical protein
MRLSRITIAAAFLVLATAAASFAQGPGGGGQFAQFREKNKYTFQLMSMVRHIGEIDKDAKYRLSPDQARRVLKVLDPLRARPKMTQDQAKDALRSLKPIFNINQLNAMARIKPPQFGGGQRGQGGPGGQGMGRPGGNGQRRPMDMNAMKDFNPFYAKAAPGGFGAERAKRTQLFITTLHERAEGDRPTHGGPKHAPAKPKGHR